MGLRGNPISMMEITFPVTLRQGQWPGCSSLHCEWFEMGEALGLWENQFLIKVLALWLVCCLESWNGRKHQPSEWTPLGTKPDPTELGGPQRNSEQETGCYLLRVQFLSFPRAVLITLFGKKCLQNILTVIAHAPGLVWTRSSMICNTTVRKLSL